MAGLDEYIFGYSDCRVDVSDLPHLTSALFKLGIGSSVASDGVFTLRERDRLRLLGYAKGKIHIDFGRTKGLYGLLISASKRRGMLLALFFVMLIFLFTRSLVWDVRIEGNERLSDSEIESILREHSFGVGSYWRCVDNSMVEASVLASHPEIAWISLNRRGTVAYVELVESENVGITEEIAPVYSNIVADRDGVIEEITVESGVATVKVGDVVRAGDILISGVVENENSVYFCHARGSVRATGIVNVTAEAPEKVTEKALTRHRIAELRLIIFNFSVNIFKNYGNRENNYDIIRETRKFALFDKYRLPFRIEKCYLAEYTDTERTLAKDEMTEYAQHNLERKMYAMFKNADVISIRTAGEFSDGAYRLTSRVVYSVNIGKESAIKIN